MLALELQLTGVAPQEVILISATLGEFGEIGKSRWGWAESGDKSHPDLFPLPPPPARHYVPAGTDWSGLARFLGVLGAVSLLTPMASVALGQDLVSPPLSAQPPSGHNVPPSAEELRRYEGDLRVVAVRAAERRLAARTYLRAQRAEPCRLGPGRRCRCRFYAFQYAAHGFGPVPTAGPRPRWMTLYLTHRYPPLLGAGLGEACEISTNFDVLLTGEGSAAERVERTFANRPFPIAGQPDSLHYWGILEFEKLARQGERPRRP